MNDIYFWKSKKTIFFFFIPILIGILIGTVSAKTGNEIPIKILITISDNILEVIKFISPLLIFVITTTGFSNIKNNRFKFIIKFFGVILITLSLLGLIVFIISYIITPFLTFKITNTDSPWIDPYFSLNLSFIKLKLVDINLLAIIFGFISGLIFSYKNFTDSKAFTIINKIQDLIYWFFKVIILPIMPLWIIGSFAQTSFSNNSSNFFLTDMLLSFLILFFQFAWLFVMYLLTSKIFNITYKKLYTAGMKIFTFVVSLAGNGTGVIIPFIVEEQEKLGIDKNKAQVVTATSFNMPGSLISNIVFTLGIINLFGLNIPISQLFSFVFVLILLTMIAPSIPGGTSAVVLPYLQSMLGFDSTMSSMYMAMYYKQGTSNAATNNASDLYITPWL